ncbi:fibroblast growth factor binding protein 2a [Genypterus blacodes]|uniref:fibroblast growth factor binding protein 2a n=1 Tax=Genypterus blacodes TaxID=154954 RepID=UPI003F767568
MWTQASALLLLACCLWLAEAQSDASRRKSIWEDPIQFQTKAKDVCTMTITGHGQLTRMRLSCQSSPRSYWCEYVGRPQMCRSYSKNPRHYFVQLMWSLRKLNNACQAPKAIKPQMCSKAGDDSQMLFSSASFPRSRTDTSARTAITQAGPKLTAKPARPEPQPESTRLESARQATGRVTVVKATRPVDPRPTAPAAESKAQRMSRQYCWRSLQGVCTFVLGWFRK